MLDSPALSVSNTLGHVSWGFLCYSLSQEKESESGSVFVLLDGSFPRLSYQLFTRLLAHKKSARNAKAWKGTTSRGKVNPSLLLFTKWACINNILFDLPLWGVIQNVTNTCVTVLVSWSHIPDNFICQGYSICHVNMKPNKMSLRPGRYWYSSSERSYLCLCKHINRIWHWLCCLWKLNTKKKKLCILEGDWKLNQILVHLVDVHKRSVPGSACKDGPQWFTIVGTLVLFCSLSFLVPVSAGLFTQI